MGKSTERLTKMKQQRDQLNARIQKMEAAEKTKAKKEDTRRKILVGAYYLDQAKQQQKTYEALVKAMDTFLTRPTDRKLFDLT